MADLNTKTCDNCGKIKQEANHWWVIEFNLELKSMFIYPIENIGKIEYKGPNKVLSACGLECLGILESRIKTGSDPTK